MQAKKDLKKDKNYESNDISLLKLKMCARSFNVLAIVPNYFEHELAFRYFASSR